MYWTDEQMDEMGADLDAERIEDEGPECENDEHDWDENAGQGQIHYNGSFELLDVCTRCDAIRHTGRYDSVL